MVRPTMPSAPVGLGGRAAGQRTPPTPRSVEKTALELCGCGSLTQKADRAHEGEAGEPVRSVFSVTALALQVVFRVAAATGNHQSSTPHVQRAATQRPRNKRTTVSQQSIHHRLVGARGISLCGRASQEGVRAKLEKERAGARRKHGAFR